MLVYTSPTDSSNWDFPLTASILTDDCESTAEFSWLVARAEQKMTGREMQIGNYKLTHQVGAGGMGTVFRALDSSGNPVALKMIGSKKAVHATVHVQPGRRPPRPLALDINSRMMFVREARVAMELNHPNITRVFDYGQHEGFLYIVMEFLSGRPLDKVIPLYAAISLSTRIALIRHLCDALSYAHRQGVIHRDIKPQNCFVIESSVLKVLDFGIAARAGQQINQELLVGTMTHMAPELFAGPPRYSESSDIWAAGITFHQLLTGRLPFTGVSLVELVKNITKSPIQPLGESLPCAKELGRILNRALAKDPASRYATAEDFAHDLANAEAALNAGSDSPDEDTDQSDSPAWWARTVFQQTALTSPAPASTGPKIAPVSGEIRVRRGGHMVRFAEYNDRILRPELVLMLLAGSYAIFSMLGGDGYSAWAPWAWMFVANVSGFLVPLLLIISAVLFGLVILEKLTAVPWCRRCRAIFRHNARVTAYAYSKVSWRHASSDCLGALKEDLWDDAPKLLAMHGELVPPGLESKTTYPPLRLLLDSYSCPCGDQFAALTTEDRIGRTWNARQEFAGAYKSQAISEAGPSVFDRLAGMVKAIARAVRLAAEPIPPRLTAILIAAGFLVVFEYWPQYPIIFGWKSPSIAIQSDPPGHGFIHHFTTPHNFQWAFHTTHIIGCDDLVYHDQKIYRFSGVTPKPYRIDNNPPSRFGSAFHDVFVEVNVLKDRWGRLTTNAVTPAYTIKYVVIGTRDYMAEARAQVESNARHKPPNPATKSPGGIGAATTQAMITVTSNPPGLAVLVDGVRVITPQLYFWHVGSGHLLIIPEGPQAPNGVTGAATQLYSDGRWDFGTGDNPRTTRINWSAVPFPYRYTARLRAVHPPNSPSRHPAADK
jgi:serine/threonine protein kinase